MKFLPILLAILLLAGCGPAKRARSMKESVAAAKTGDWPAAYKAALACQTSQEDDPGALAMLALTQYQVDSTTLASSLELMEKALALTPERYDLLYMKGWLLMHGARYKDALAVLQQAYDLHMNSDNNSHVPENVEGAIQYCIAVCNFHLHKNDDAISYMEKAMRHSNYSQSPELLNNLAVLRMRKKQYDKATLDLLNKARTAKPNFPEYNINMAVCVDLYPDKARAPGWYSLAQKCINIALNDKNITASRKQDLLVAKQQIDARLRKLPKSAPKSK